MRVIGIDPGYDRLGVAVMEKQAGVDRLLFSTCIETDKKADLADRLLTAGEALRSIITEYQPTVVGIETLFFNKNVKTAIGVAQARGMIIFLAKEAGCKVLELSPQQIKVAVTGYGNSDKTAVLRMVQRLVTPVPENALDDEYDAIAVAISTLAHLR